MSGEEVVFVGFVQYRSRLQRLSLKRPVAWHSWWRAWFRSLRKPIRTPSEGNGNISECKNNKITFLVCQTWKNEVKNRLDLLQNNAKFLLLLVVCSELLSLYLCWKVFFPAGPINTVLCQWPTIMQRVWVFNLVIGQYRKFRNDV